MRMWMVDPSKMCRKHLLGEHVEIHMLAGSLNKGRSVAGFLADGLLEPQSMRARHAVLAAEMASRGYRHQSPLPATPVPPSGSVDRVRSAQELARRCSACAACLGYN
jgi:hypothetical protein